MIFILDSEYFLTKIILTQITLTVNLIAPVVMDVGTHFSVREGGITVGAGVVTKVY